MVFIFYIKKPLKCTWKQNVGEKRKKLESIHLAERYEINKINKKEIMRRKELM